MTWPFVVGVLLILCGLSLASIIWRAAERIPAEGWDTVGSAAYFGLALILVGIGLVIFGFLYG